MLAVLCFFLSRSDHVCVCVCDHVRKVACVLISLHSRIVYNNFCPCIECCSLPPCGVFCYFFSLHFFICSRFFYVFCAALSLKYTLCMLVFFVVFLGYLYECDSLQLLHQIQTQFGSREKGRERHKAIETTETEKRKNFRNCKNGFCSRSSVLTVCMYHLFNVPTLMSIFALFSAKQKI